MYNIITKHHVYKQHDTSSNNKVIYKRVAWNSAISRWDFKEPPLPHPPKIKEHRFQGVAGSTQVESQ